MKKLNTLNLIKGIGIIMIIMVHNRHFLMQDMSGLRTDGVPAFLFRIWFFAVLLMGTYDLFCPFQTSRFYLFSISSAPLSKACPWLFDYYDKQSCTKYTAYGHSEFSSWIYHEQRTLCDSYQYSVYTWALS